MELGTIIAKEKQYTEKLAELSLVDVDKIVDEQLEPARIELKTKVSAELQADITKCKNYLELLAELKTDYIEEHKTEEETTPEQSTQAETIPTSVAGEEVL